MACTPPTADACRPTITITPASPACTPCGSVLSMPGATPIFALPGLAARRYSRAAASGGVRWTATAWLAVAVVGSGRRDNGAVSPAIQIMVRGEVG